MRVTFVEHTDYPPSLRWANRDPGEATLAWRASLLPPYYTLLHPAIRLSPWTGEDSFSGFQSAELFRLAISQLWREDSPYVDCRP